MHVYFIKPEDPSVIRKATILRTSEQTDDGSFVLLDQYGNAYVRKSSEFSHDIDAVKAIALDLCVQRAAKLTQEATRLSSPILTIEE